MMLMIFRRLCIANRVIIAGVQGVRSPSGLGSESPSGNSVGQNGVVLPAGSLDNGALTDLLRRSNTSGSGQDAPAIRGPQGQDFSPGLNQQTGETTGNGIGMNDLSADQIRAANAAQVREAAPNTDWNTFSADEAKMSALESNPAAAATAREYLEKRAGNEELSSELSEGYGLSALAQSAPRDQGQPTAVQVRISNPDKL